MSVYQCSTCGTWCDTSRDHDMFECQARREQNGGRAFEQRERSMAWTPDLEEVIAFVADAHQGQKDRAGRPYIIHLIRVMLRMETWEEQYVALLHDILEDTKVTAQDLVEFCLPDEIVTAVIALTRKEGEPYQEFIARCHRHSNLSRRVKIADLQDHLEDTSSLTPEHVQRYEDALAYLTQS